MRVVSCRLFFGMLPLVVMPIVAVESMLRVVGSVEPKQYSKRNVRCVMTALVASKLVSSSAPRV